MGFKSINNLAKSIRDLTNLIEVGSISSEEMDSLIDHVQALQERLFILRYKIQERQNEFEANDNKTPKKEVEIPVLFKVEPIVQSPVAPNQTSLIDIIEEIEEEKKPLEIQAALFSLSDEKVEIESKNKPSEEKASAVNKKKQKKKSKPKKMEQGKSLVDKLNAAPITDLKKSINLNLKFRFIKALYNNESEEYNDSIEALNNAESFAQAKEILAEVKSKYGWKEDLEEEELLLELLERKYEA